MNKQSMLQVKEKVFCIMKGVCVIEEIVKIKHKDKSYLDYYRLTPVMDPSCTIYSPVHSSKSRLRSIKSVEEWYQLLNDATRMKDKWSSNEQRRVQRRNEAIKNDDTRSLISLFRMYCQTKETLLNSNDLSWMRMAEQILISELSESMNISFDEALDKLLQK